MAINIAIYGYDTDIGKLIIETLEEQHLDFNEIYPLSPLNGEYDAVQINSRNYFVQPISQFDFSKASIAFFLTTPEESRNWVDKARNEGCIVIDDSRLFTGNGNTCLMVPEINPYDAVKAIETRLVTPALASSTQLSLSLSALHDEFGVDAASAVALESVSEQGRLGTETLARETTMLLNGMAGEHMGFSAQVAFNLHTAIGTNLDDGATSHERDIESEVVRLLGKFTNGFDVTCIQVPVFYGHTIALNVTLEEKTDVKSVARALEESGYLKVCGSDANLTPVTDSINERKILIGRLKACGISGKKFSFITMMDNVRRGEAISCVEIAKILAKQLV